MPRFSIFTPSNPTSSSAHAHGQKKTGLSRTFTPNDYAIVDEHASDEKPTGSSFEHSSASVQPADATAPALPDTPDTVPICPHESLTSARAALIADLPNLKPINQLAKPKEVDALTLAPSTHHRLPYTSDVQLKTACEPLGRVFPTSSQKGSSVKMQTVIRVRGEGGYIYSFTPHYAHDDPMLDTRPSRMTPCLMLSMTWIIYVPPATKPAKTIEELRQEVEKAGVQLCAHKHLSDRKILETIFKMVNPDVGLRDPIVRYKAIEEGYNCKLNPFPFPIPLIYERHLLRINGQSYEMTMA